MVSKHLRDTSKLARSLAQKAFPGLVIGLDGPLGAGKTRFAQDFAKALGVQDPVTSPTFSLVNEYHGRLPFFHMDLYRLSDSEEFENMGGLEYFEQGGVCLIEWSVRIADVLPPDAWKINIDLQDDQRIFTGEGVDL